MPGHDVIAAQGTKAGLLCPECKFVLKEAVQTPEGIRLCQSCYKQIEREPNYTSKKTGINVQDEDGKPFCFPDKAVRRDVKNLEVQCNNWKLGCKWVGKLENYIDTHKAQCVFKPEPCPQCNEAILRDELKKHLATECCKRSVVCEHCREEVIYEKLQEHHKEDCGKFPLKCEHCGHQVPREKMDNHQLRECELVKCTCGDLLNRNTHEDDPKSVSSHLSSPAVLLTHLLTIFSLGQDLIKQFKQFDSRLVTLEGAFKNGASNSNTQSLPQDWSRFRKDIEKRFREMTERLTPIQDYYTASSDKNLSTKVQDLRAKMNVLEEKNVKQDIEINRLKSQLEHQTLSSSWNPSGTSSSRSYSNTELQRLGHLERKYEDVERQVTMLKVHVSEMELQLQASLASTYNGSFMWRIPDLSKRKRDAIDGRVTSLYSPPFYTAKNGYKMCIRVYLNGDGMGHKTHLSLFFVLMKGEFDALLKWPFDYKVSLILVDQNHRKHIVQTFKPTPESSSFQRPVSDMNVASGCPQFCKLSYLDDENYTKDDVLFIKCIVDTSRIFHP